MKAVLYIHGKGGSIEECHHYEALFKDYDVLGIDYKADEPWNVKQEIEDYIHNIKDQYTKIIVIANSIGAFYVMNSNISSIIDHAYFISPIVDMEKLILDMMHYAHVTEEELKKEKVITTDIGEDLSWDYLCYVRSHPYKWDVPTDILYGEKDTLTSYDTINGFKEEHYATLTVMQKGEHWFHTDAQMSFLDDWIKRR